MLVPGHCHAVGSTVLGTAIDRPHFTFSFSRLFGQNGYFCTLQGPISRKRCVLRQKLCFHRPFGSIQMRSTTVESIGEISLRYRTSTFCTFFVLGANCNLRQFWRHVSRSIMGRFVSGLKYSTDDRVYIQKIV